AWLAGVFLLLARQGWLHVKLRRLLRAGREVSDLIVRDVFHRCRQELGVARSRRLLATGLLGPATCGTFRASILLPERLLSLLPLDELRLVFLHELTHMRRWDVPLDRIAALL